MGEPLRSSPLALASPFGRRGDAKGDSVRAASRREAVASHRASGVSPSGASGVIGHGAWGINQSSPLLFHLSHPSFPNTAIVNYLIS